MYFIEKYDAVNISKSRALSYHQKAIENISIFSESKEKICYFTYLIMLLVAKNND